VTFQKLTSINFNQPTIKDVQSVKITKINDSHTNYF